MGGLRLPEALAAAIRGHGREAYPNECCGFLLGALGGSAVSELARASNAREAAAATHRYLIPPEDFVRVQRDADARGLDILGFYHSHPDHPARPSEFDRDHAWPGYAYLIVAVTKGEPQDLRGFQLATVGGAFEDLVLEEA